MSWKDIIKSDKRGLRDWFNSPSPKEKKKPRKPSYKPRTRGFSSAYDAGELVRRRALARRKWKETGSSKHMPKTQPVRQPTQPTKPKTKIIPRTLIDNYFEMYANQGKGTPTLEDIQREEGRPLTVDEKENYYAKKGEK